MSRSRVTTACTVSRGRAGTRRPKAPAAASATCGRPPRADVCRRTPFRADGPRRTAGRISYVPRPTRRKYFHRWRWWLGALTQQRLMMWVGAEPRVGFGPYLGAPTLKGSMRQAQDHSRRIQPRGLEQDEGGESASLLATQMDYPGVVLRRRGDLQLDGRARCTWPHLNFRREFVDLSHAVALRT